MTISVNEVTKVITVPQADLNFIGGTTYEHDTDAFRLELKDWESSTEGSWRQRTHLRNPPVTVGGVTLAQALTMINGFTITYEDGQYRVILIGSNNNILESSNVNQVSVSPTNSAGLIIVVSGSGVTQQDKDDIEAQIFAHTMEDGENFEQAQRLVRAAAAGQVIQLANGDYLIKSKDGLKDRIDGSLGSNNSRDIDATDSS